MVFTAHYPQHWEAMEDTTKGGFGASMCKTGTSPQVCGRYNPSLGWVPGSWILWILARTARAWLPPALA